MGKSDLVTIDFETKPIEQRPAYPPPPVGVSVKYRGKKPSYFAFGHPTKNNCTLSQAKDAVRDAYRSGSDVLCHNGKFDLDVSETFFKLKPPAWNKTHDTMYQLFLHDPHSRSLSLKPSAERLLGMKPKEQDAMFDWLVDQGVLGKNQQKKVGEHIFEVPGDIVGEYCNGDVVRTEKLHDLLYPKIIAASMGGAYDRERKLMPILLESEREGVRVDVDALEHDLKKYEKAQQKTDAWLRKRLRAPELNIDSDNEIADALENANVVTQWVPTRTGKRSTAKKNMTADLFSDKRVYQALGYRNRVQTCLSIFIRPWLEMARVHGRIYTNWNQVRQAHGEDNTVGARTGRISCTPNFQNIPKDWYDKDDGYEHPRFLGVPELPMMRKYVLGDKGELWGRRDYSQQEPRILAHFENDKLCAQYNVDPTMDVHRYAQIEIEKATGKKMERRPVKITFLGEIYGRGTGSLAAALGISYNEAKALKKSLRKVLPGLGELDEEIKSRGRSGKPIHTWGGRLYYCEEPRMVNKPGAWNHGRMQTFEYKLLNYLIQGSASDCTKESIIRYDDSKKNGKFRVTVHDENGISAPAKAMKKELLILREAMESVEFDVQMRTDAEMGPNWGMLKEVKEKR